MKKIAGLLLIILVLYTLLPAVVFSVCTNHEVRINGTSFYFYNGSKINLGNVTAITVEKQEKSIGLINNGDWSLVFSACTEESEFIGLKVSDNLKVVGFYQLKIVTDNPSTATVACTVQNVSLSGYGIDADNGSLITGGVVKASISDTAYINSTTFTGSNWSIDLYPCLTSGKYYTLHIILSNAGGTKAGEYSTSYLAG